MTSASWRLQRLRSRARPALLAGLVATAAGCPSATIRAFTASPRRFCPESKGVTLTWSVDGSVELSAAPPLAELGKVESSGWRQLPAQDRTVTLTASKFLASDVKDVQVVSRLDPPEVIAIGPDSRDVTCDEARGEVVAALSFEVSEYDPLARVLRLENAWDREIAVAHRGDAWTVRPGEALTLQPRAGPVPDPGVRAGGTWVLRARLAEGERCGTPSAGALLHIQLNATIGC